MTLHDQIQADGLKVFCRLSDFAESIVYYPRVGAARTIAAIVVREPLSVLPEDGDNVLPNAMVYVANDATQGIASSEINLGGDALEFAVRNGKTPTRRTIVRLTEHDEGMLVLECR
jgi:hypothetical protein